MTNIELETGNGQIARRTALGVMAGAALAATLAGGEARAADAPLVIKPYELPPLPYDKGALDGFLSAEILEIHHDKHHAGYVKGLNATLDAMADARKKGDHAAIKHLARQLAFNGSGHALHTLYWHSMSPKGGGKPGGSIGAAIDASFGGFDAFKAQFAAATKNAEGSGWGVLAWEPLGGRLVILAAESHEQMGFVGTTPLVACDVWEHAYYLRYKNDRGTYVDRFFDVIDWRGAASRLDAARA